MSEKETGRPMNRRQLFRTLLVAPIAGAVGVGIMLRPSTVRHVDNYGDGEWWIDADGDVQWVGTPPVASDGCLRRILTLRDRMSAARSTGEQHEDNEDRTAGHP